MSFTKRSKRKGNLETNELQQNEKKKKSLTHKRKASLKNVRS